MTIPVVTEEEIKVKGIKPLCRGLYLDPTTRVLLEYLEADEERNGSEVIRRLIRQEAARRGFWSPPPKPWEEQK